MTERPRLLTREFGTIQNEYVVFGLMGLSIVLLFLGLHLASIGEMALGLLTFFIALGWCLFFATRPFTVTWPALAFISLGVSLAFVGYGLSHSEVISPQVAAVLIVAGILLYLFAIWLTR